MESIVYQDLKPTTWPGKYPGVFIPKYRKKRLCHQLRRHWGKLFHDLAPQKEGQIEKGHLRPDQVHLLIAIPPQ